MQSILYFSVALLFCSLFIQDVLTKNHGRLSKKSNDGKIVGGQTTTINEYPYQVHLLLKKGNDYYQCGGSIIGSHYILTAAHCLKDISVAYARTGSTMSNEGGTMYTSSQLVMHPYYNPRTSDYDVGYIYIEKGMTLDEKTTKVVSLPSKGTTASPGTILHVSGWGTTSENGDTSVTLMEVAVPVISNSECRKSYAQLTDRMICAGDKEGGKDSCQGDSGGPAVSNTTGVQLGVVSFGIGCARPGYPGVYTNVANSSIRSWIKRSTGI